MKKTDVILVDENDSCIGYCDKQKAHEGKGLLHRAVSVLLLRNGKHGLEVLLQKRSSNKKLWPGFWTNTVCTHPFENETYIHAAQRRLGEEMGIAIPERTLHTIIRFVYQAQYTPTYAEHELDTVLIGEWDGIPRRNRKEVDEYKWESVSSLRLDMEKHPDVFTPWFHLMLSFPEIQKEMSLI